MTFTQRVRERNSKVLDSLKETVQAPLRAIARLTGLSKDAVRRAKQAQDKHSVYPESSGKQRSKELVESPSDCYVAGVWRKLFLGSGLAILLVTFGMLIGSHFWPLLFEMETLGRNIKQKQGKLADLNSQVSEALIVLGKIENETEILQSLQRCVDTPASYQCLAVADNIRLKEQVTNLQQENSEQRAQIAKLEQTNRECDADLVKCKHSPEVPPVPELPTDTPRLPHPSNVRPNNFSCGDCVSYTKAAQQFTALPTLPTATDNECAAIATKFNSQNSPCSGFWVAATNHNA